MEAAGVLLLLAHHLVEGVDQPVEALVADGWRDYLHVQPPPTHVIHPGLQTVQGGEGLFEYPIVHHKTDQPAAQGKEGDQFVVDVFRVAEYVPDGDDRPRDRAHHHNQRIGEENLLG